MPSFNSLLENNNIADNVLPSEYTSEKKRTNLMSKVFGIMFLTLLGTAGLSFVIYYLFVEVFAAYIADYDLAYLLLFLISGIGLAVMAFVLPSALAKNKRSILTPYIIFTIFMSAFFSSLYMLYEIKVLLATLIVSAISYGSMAICGLLSKGSIKPVFSLMAGLTIGCIALSIINFILWSPLIAWAVSFGILAVFLLSSMAQVKQVKLMIYNGTNNDYNLVLYGALLLYLDFLNVFIRMLPYIAKIASKND